MADSSAAGPSAPPTEGVANLHLDEATGEMVSKSELKKRLKQREKEEAKRKKVLQGINLNLIWWHSRSHDSVLGGREEGQRHRRNYQEEDRISRQECRRRKAIIRRRDAKSIG